MLAPLQERPSFSSFLSYAREKIETWFVFPASREYLGIKPTTFFSTNRKKYPYVKLTAKYVFS